MAVVRVVQMAIHKVIGVIAVGHRFMAAAGAMLVPSVVSGALMAVGALGRILRGNIQTMLIDVVSMHAMEVPVVQIINVVAVADGGVSAIVPVLVSVVLMDLVFAAHSSFS
jgi:hypothetical protein